MRRYHVRCYDGCMSAVGLGRENEVKIAVRDPDALEERLRALGFTILHARTLESNLIYDTPEAELRRRGELIRIREAGGGTIFTYKGPATVTRHKEREELEVDIGNGFVLGTILERLGYVPRFRYEKYRTEWSVPGEAGIVMVDETPIGIYIEIEGAPEWVDRRAAELGYDESEYLNLSYARLYAQYCQQLGVEPRNMTFAEAPKRPGTGS